MIKWRKLSVSLLVSSLLLPIAPHNILAEEANQNQSREEVEEIISESDTSHLFETVINAKAVNTYEVNEVTEELESTGRRDFNHERIYVLEKIDHEDTSYLLIRNDDDLIGWIDEEVIRDSQTQENTDSHDTLHNDLDNQEVNELEETEDDDFKVDDYPSQIKPTVKEDSLEISKEETIPTEDTSPTEDDDNQESNSVSLSSFSVQSSTRYHEVQSQTPISYAAEIIQPWSINTRPWGTEGAELVASARQYLGETVDVIQEKVTERGTYALIKSGRTELGWIDVTGIKPHTISNERTVNYTVEITQPWSINTQPWGVRGFERAVTGNVQGQEFIVTKEAVTPRSTFVLLTKNGTELGWIDSTGIEERISILSEQSINYAAKIVKPWSVNTRPWGTVGATPVVQSGSLVGDTVTVMREKTTVNGTYSLISKNNNEIGWVDKTALEIHSIQTRNTVDYYVEITKPWSINTLPWGVEGFEVVQSSASIGDNFKVIQEVTTPRSKYLLLENNGNPLGWIDHTGAVKTYTVLSTKDTSYAAEVTKPWSVNTEPWGIKGAVPVVEAGELLGETVTVNQEKITQRGTFAMISVGGKKIGWIDKSGLSLHRVLNSRTVNYNVNIVKPWSINSLPWGVEGFKTVQSARDLINQELRVIRESSTQRSLYLLLEKDGQTLGWIDSTGVDNVLKVSSNRQVNYSAKIVQPWSINTQPWGTAGAQPVNNYSQFLGKRVTITEEKTTQRGTYALVNYEGKEIGWIDKTGLSINPVIVLDPGHGGTDPGARATLDGKTIKEKDLNLDISLKIRDELVKQGYTVIMTREDDRTISMVDRARFANNTNADIFVSIHHNSMPPGYTSVNGIETIYYTPNPNFPPIINQEMHNDKDRISESQRLAYSVQDSLISNTGANYRRVFGGAYVVVRETTMPAIIPEFGFMSNPTELRKMTTKSYQNQLVKGLVQGINNYFNY